MASGRYVPIPVGNSNDVSTLNQNLDNIANALDNVVSRESGNLPNGMNTTLDMNGHAIINQLNPLQLDAFTWLGNWETGTAYSLDDTVFYNSSSYICIRAHTSGTFGADLATNKWQLVVLGTVDRGTWTGPSTYYFLGDIITDGSDLYKCIVNNLSTASFAADLASGWWALYTSFLGSMALQNANAVNITGGAIAAVTLASSAATITGGAITGVTIDSSPIVSSSINSSVIGGSTPSAATFTTALLTSAISGGNQATTKSYVDAAFTTGSIALAGGLIFKYGTVTVPLANVQSASTSSVPFRATIPTTVTFPVAFPTSCFFANLITTQFPYTVQGSWSNGIQLTAPLSAAAFTFQASWIPQNPTAVNQNWVLNWWALGN